MSQFNLSTAVLAQRGTDNIPLQRAPTGLSVLAPHGSVRAMLDRCLRASLLSAALASAAFSALGGAYLLGYGMGKSYFLNASRERLFQYKKNFAFKA